MDLLKILGHRVRITCDEGQIFVGKATDYASAYDNDPEPESITIETDDGLYVDLEPGDIASVEFLD